MTASDYLFGSLALAIGLLPWVPASTRLARRLVPRWNGPESALAACLIGITGVIVVAELLGLVSGIRRWPFALTSAVVAALVARLGVAAAPAQTRRLRLPRERGAQIMLGCVAVCVMATTASLIGRDAAVLQTGPLDTDSIHYHLTQAAHLVQTHSDVHLHHSASSDGTVFYPYDVELLDAIAMLGPHPDLAVFGLNLLFGWLALLACWVIGARWSAAAPALAAGAAVIALPIVSQASTGPGLNDIPAMAFVLAALGCLAAAGREWPGEVAVAGLALGLAAGTKLDALPIAALMAVAAVIAAAGHRARTALALFAPAMLAGGFWYVRDWVTVGTPVPDTNLTVAGHGFHVVPYPEVKPYAFSVAHYLGNASVIRHWFAPGLRVVWTDLWPVVLLLLVAGVVLAVLFETTLFRRLLGVAVVIAFAVYLVTPTTAMGSDGQPLLFATNTRYVLPLLAVAAVLAATASVLRRFAVPVTVALTALMVALLGLGSLPQPVDYTAGVAGAVLVATAVAWLGAVRSVQGLGRLRVLFVAALALAAVGGGAAIQRSYLHHRYAGPSALEQLFRTVGGYQHQRIGVAGHGFQYGFFGPHFSNTVNYVGVSAPSRAFDGPTSCPALIDTLTRLRDDYVVLEPLPVENTDRLAGWIAAIPRVRVVFSNDAGTVYQLPAVITGAGCATVSPT
ncbi:MAG TPA: hypothetical protein VG650_05285 [Mycobacteriales bacterium]|nr:hypothetical protein [Mycobacteriales bacterium]HWC34224.1 hypothetical protein [Mycobacteriales bacterium]